MDSHDYMKATGGGIYPMSGSVVSHTPSSSSVPQKRYDQDSKELQWIFKSDNIRIRDNYTCRLCGAKDVPLDVHHIRYISGREAWDYEDGDLVTLCKKCHEAMHNVDLSKKLKVGDYFYHIYYNGVGIVERLQEDKIGFNVCWQESGLKANGHLVIKSEAMLTDIRPATREEIRTFWGNVNKQLDNKTIVEHLYDYIEEYLPADHPIKERIERPYKNAIAQKFAIECKLIERYQSTVLISEDDYAGFCTVHSKCTDDPFPKPGFHITPKKQMEGKAIEFSKIVVAYNDLDFHKYRTPTQEEIAKYESYYEKPLEEDLLKAWEKMAQYGKGKREWAKSYWK